EIGAADRRQLASLTARAERRDTVVAGGIDEPEAERWIDEPHERIALRARRDDGLRCGARQGGGGALGRPLRVERHGYGAGRHDGEVRDDPLRVARAEQRHAVALADAARTQAV